jgi:hypothetical protein
VLTGGYIHRIEITGLLQNHLPIRGFVAQIR